MDDDRRDPLRGLLAEPEVVLASDPVAAVRRRLLGDDAPASLVVLDDADGPRVVMADAVLTTPLAPRTTMRQVACCPPSTLPRGVDLRTAVAAATARPAPHRGHDLLVAGRDGGVRVVTVADLAAALVTGPAQPARVEPRTGLSQLADVTRALGRALADGARPVAVARLALDDLVHVEQQHGGPMADRVLQSVARRVGNGLRDGDVAGATEDGELVVLLRVDDAHEARVALERLVERMTAPVEQGLLRVDVEPAAGLVVGTPGVDTADALLAEATRLLDRARRGGGGILTEAVADGVVTRGALGAALAEDAFTLHYQPVVSLDGGPDRSVEALVRLSGDDSALVPPDRFVPLAEATGQIVDIDWWVVAQAADQLARWDAAGVPVRTMHVNLSARTLTTPGIVSHVARVLDQAELAPDRLLLEVPEAGLARDVGRAVTVLRALQERGIGTVVDGFGAGPSSLVQLARLPVRGLKVDRSLVAALGERTADRDAVRLARTLSTELGVGLSATGVETRAQASTLTELGVEQAQGWLWGRATDAASVHATPPDDDDRPRTAVVRPA